MKNIRNACIALCALFILTWCSSEVLDRETAALDENTIVIETDFGKMEAVLYDETPGHRDNFIKLVWEGFYDDLLFHRVIQWFMIQGGDPDSRDAASGTRLGTWGPGYQIPAEIWAYHFKWTLAAARTWGAGNPEKKSSGSQFYIVHGKVLTDAELDGLQAQKWIVYTPEQRERYKTIWWTPMLDEEYTVFGEVTIWLDVIDKIAAVQKDRSDRPLEDVKMVINLK